MVKHNHESPSPASNVSRWYPKHVKSLGKLKSSRGNYVGNGEPGRAGYVKITNHLETCIGKNVQVQTVSIWSP